MNSVWKDIYTALACDIMDGMGYREQALSHELRPARDDNWFAGPAVTLDAHVNEEPNDDPYGKIFEAYDLVSAGDVIVVATNGEVKSGLWGELLSTAAAARGVNAVVTDGLVRDIRLMNDMGFNCFCRGYSPLDSAGRIVPQAVQVPVTCGGVQIQPGDFILADYEGVVSIPAAIKDEVLLKSQEKLAGENTVRDELATGRSPREVFDEYGIL
ncbi:MAG: RraA family protein [Gemmatimonadetes bacterium]|jgi:4-hydroxy-4-methyl-2-oxoglutarate aldolase|nr:RraA family protein [Gemmatimonadota bacterium]MBT7863834.1 RraA family protein [Gemmatimonadota bacterium]